METLYEICCGIDVHKDKLVVCLKKGKSKIIKEFGTKPRQLKELADWLLAEGCEMVAMESTASYWKPLYNVFEVKGVNVIVVNAKDMKNVPGKKTDVLDSEWIADLLKHGLLRPSYIPERDQRELRELTRYRKSLTEERARELNRLQKMLEGANIKIGSVLSDVNSKSSRNLIEYAIENDTDMDCGIVSELVNNVKASYEDIADAMGGTLTNLQKELIKEVLSHIDDMAVRINKVSKIIKDHMTQYKKNMDKLTEMDGIGQMSAEIILAEIGQDMSRFPTAACIASWAGVAPGNNESAGKRRSGKTLKGNKTLKSTLAQCAKSAVKKKMVFIEPNIKD